MKLKQKGFAVLPILLILVLVGILVYMFFRVQKTSAPSTSSDSTATNATTNQTTDKLTVKAVDETKIPLGDGKVSSSPKKGYVMSCSTSFRGGGAEHAGGWLGSTTWNSMSKPTVDGSVSWPNASNSIKISGGKRIVTTNDLPKGSTTGIFPIKASDDAYQYDRNPNSILPQSVVANLTANPTKASSASCVPMGEIGYLTNGVELYNALDDAGRDAAAHEVQDSCDGHPQMKGAYHYHNLSACVAKTASNGTLIGYALDGYGIYVEKDSKGNLLTNAELDECHGRTSQVMWDGKKTNIYHYVMTLEYPYSIGCFRGTPIKSGPRAN